MDSIEFTMYKETFAMLGVCWIVTKEDNSCRRKCNFKWMLTDVEEFRPPGNCDVLMGYLTPSPPHSHIYMEASTCPYHRMAHCLSVGLVLTLAVATLLSAATGRFCTDWPLFSVLLNGTRGEFRPRQTRQLPRAVDLKGRLLSCQSY